MFRAAVLQRDVEKDVDGLLMKNLKSDAGLSLNVYNLFRLKTLDEKPQELFKKTLNNIV